MLNALVFTTRHYSEREAYDLEFDCFAVYVDCTNLKVDTYCAKIAFRVGIFGESQEETRLNSKTFSSSGASVVQDTYLSYSRITDEEEFEEVVVVVRHFRLGVLVVVVKQAEVARSP